MGELLEVDHEMLNDVCAQDENLSHMHKMRTRQFLERQATTHSGFERFAVQTPPISEKSHIPFPAESGMPTLDAQGSRALSSRPRNSGITLPAEFLAERNHNLGKLTEYPEQGMPASYRDPEPPAVKRTRHSQSMRHIGGASDRQRQSDAFANSGGGPGGLGANVNIHSIKSKHALEVEHKTRLKLEVLAVTENPTWDGHVRPWREFSIDFIRQMAAAGHDIVCRPEYTEIAQQQGWVPERIVEGRKFVWNQLLVCCKDAPRAKNALLMAGPEYDGETAFHQLEVNNKISGHALKQQLDDELLHFAPKGREEPPDMIVRFDLLLTAHLDIESADTWSPEKKIKKILSLLRHWDDLKVTVDIERDKLLNYSTVLMEHIPIARMKEERLMSYTSVCTKIKASWDSFVATDIKTTKIRSAKIAMDRPTTADANKSSDSVQLQILEHLKIMSTKLNEDEKKKTPKASP